MKIYFDEDGSILEVARSHLERPGKFIEVDDRKVPDDLLTTFALGKYRVAKGKLAVKRSFEAEEESPVAAFFPELLRADGGEERRDERREGGEEEVPRRRPRKE